MFKSPDKLKKMLNSKDPLLLNDKTVVAIKKMKELGKIPYIFSRGKKIRVCHRGCYFDYSAQTGKWIYTRSAGRRKWNSSKSVDDFLKKADAFVDWYNSNVRRK